MTWYIIKLIVLLPLVCGLLVGCLYAWRKLESRLPRNQTTRMVGRSGVTRVDKQQ